MRLRYSKNQKLECLLHGGANIRRCSWCHMQLCLVCSEERATDHARCGLCQHAVGPSTRAVGAKAKKPRRIITMSRTRPARLQSTDE